MKKTIFILLLSLLLVFSASCKKPEDTPDIPEPTPLERVQEHINLEEFEEAYDILTTLEGEEAEKLLSRFSFKPDKITDTYIGGDVSTQTFEYDKYGNILKKETAYKDNIRTEKYEYDEFSRRIKREYRNENLIKTIYWTWDENGNEVKRRVLENGGTLLVVKNEYNEQGNRIYSHTKTPDLWIEETLEYDENGNRTLLKTVYSSGDETVEIFEYDDTGNILKDTLTDLNYGVISTHEYEYSESGKVYTYTDSGKVIQKNTYDSEDRLILEEYPSNASGLIRHEKEYTDSGLEKKSKMFELSRTGKEIYSETVWEYDEDDNLIKTENSYSNGDVYTEEMTYHENGQIKSLINYKNGEVQAQLFYNEKGLIIKNISEDYYNYDYSYDKYGNLLKVDDTRSPMSTVYEGYKLYYNPHNFDNESLN